MSEHKNPSPYISCNILASLLSICSKYCRTELFIDTQIYILSAYDELLLRPMFNFLMILIAPVPLRPDFGCFSRPTVGKLFAWPDFGRVFRLTVGQSFAWPDFGFVFRLTVGQLFARPDFGCFSRPTVGQSFAWPDFGRVSRPTVGKSLRTVVLSDLFGCVPGGRNPDVEND